MNATEIGRAIRAFRSEACPACGAEKIARADPFCPECMARLPDDLLERLHDRERFIGAFGPAMRIVHGGPEEI